LLEGKIINTITKVLFMKKVFLLFSMGLIALLMNMSAAFSQLSEGGTPSSFIFKSQINNVIDARQLPSIDVETAIMEDANRPGPAWVGRSVPVGLNMLNSGTWTVLPDGNRIWRLKLTSVGAKAIAVYYDNFYIPEGGKLFLYNESHTQIIGAYTSKNNPKTKLFSTELIQGETVYLEYVAPKTPKLKTDPNAPINGTVNGTKITSQNTLVQTNDAPVISISEIAYVYKEVRLLEKYNPAKSTGWGQSDTCEVDINCSEGTNWQVQKKGVAEIFIKNGTNYGFCSGTLTNTTNNSGIPYFLTASHCYGMPDAPAPDTEPYASTADLTQWQFYFNYELAGCGGTVEPGYNTLTGCTLKANSPVNGGSDFTLVLLTTTPPQSYHPYYNGWNRTNTAATSGVGIHHPAGDVKKISTYTSSATTSFFNGGTGLTAVANSGWNVTWVQTPNGHGVTEGGSSGSPLFNQAKLQIGTLSGGNSSCTNKTGTNIYGKFWYHWDQTAGGTTTQLKTWLDPTNAGSTTVNGYDPYGGYPDFYGTPTSLYVGQSVNFTDITASATSWAWEFEGGIPATSTVQNPTNIVYNTQGTFKVKLTTTTALAGTQTMEKVAYITVNPGSAATSIWCDNFSTPANWTLSTSGGYTNAWVIGTAAPTGTYSTDMGRISSTSGGNYALFDSDALGAANNNQWANLTTATGQNCSSYEGVTLKFEQNYMKFYDSTLVYVSTDNFATSTKYVVNGDYANNGASANPETVRLDISSAAAGKTNVKIRFTFRSTQDMNTNAGWGYSWQIDDVCMEGITYGNSLPIPDFTATTTKKVSPGQSVSYADQSQLATSWLWTFEGGTPSTSTAQNPTNIVYNTQGYYPVTLTATNQNGSVSTTKTDYIHVFYDCSFDSNIQDADGVSYYRAATGSVGYLPGFTNTTVTAFADKYTIGNLTGKVKSMAVGVATAMVVGGTTNVTFTIWDNNAGVPGAVLMSKDVPVKSLEAGMINYIDFTPTAVGSTFFAGFQLPTVASLDTFTCYLASGAGGRTNTAYCKDGANWVTYQAKYGINGSLYVLPEFCLDKPLTNVPDVDFFASQTEITPGSTISFTDQSTGGPAPTSWAWTLTGGSPVSSTTQNPPSVTYSAPGIYDVALNATNANGVGSKTKGGYILVANDSVIVKWTFPNTSANVTADGGATANLAKTISVCADVVAPAFTNTGASGGLDKCASSTGWNDAVATVNDYWMAEFTTAGFTNIKLSSKQSGKTTAAPKNFAVYYSVDGGNNFSYLTAVPAITTAANWTQGVLTNVPMPAECDNQESVMLLWLKVDNVSMAGGTPTAAAVTYIDDIYVVGQTCSTLPGTPGTITGPATVCQGATNQVYTVPPIANATYYTWTVPTGVTIVGGTYTNSITVDFAANAVAGSITVKGENLCGVGPSSASKTFTVTALPIAPSAITGIQAVTNGQTGVSYSVPAVSGATSYTWTVPSFATITAGSTTTGITTSFSCPGGNGNISVHANNGCGAGPESYAKAITINCPPASNFYASSTQVCVGGTITFTDISTNNPTSWLWTFPGGTPATSTLEHPTVTYSTLGVYNVTLQVTNANGNNSSTKTTYINVGVPAQPSAITGSATPCGASTQTYSVTNVPGVTYTWTYPAGWAVVSGAGTSSITLTVGATSGTVQVTPSNTCGNGTAQTLSTTVATAVAASVSIAASANPVCAGTSVTITPTPTNGGTTPTYQWKVGASVMGTGATYVSSALANGDVVTCIMTSNANCVTGSPATSNAVTMTVSPATVGGTVTGGTTICTGSTSGLLTLAGHTGTIVRWESSVSPFSTWTPITNTAATYTSGALSATTQFRAVVQSGSCATANSATTTVTVDPASVGGTVTGGTTICTGSTSGLLTLAGHTGTIVRWESSVSPFSTWTPIANITTTYTSGALSATTQFRVVVQSGSCATANSATTTVTVSPASVGGTVTGGTTICTGSTSGLLTLAGHTGTIVRWESSVSPFSTWTPITNTAATYTSGALSATTQFRAVVQSGSCATANSATTTVTVNPASVGGTVTGGTTICTGSTSGLLTLAGHTGTIVRWESSVSPFSTWTPITNTAATYTSGALSATTQFRAVVQSGSCATANSATTTVTVSPATVGGTVTGGTTICTGSTSGLLTLAGHTGTIVRWESSVSPFSTWVPITNTAATYTSGALSATTQFRAVVQSGSCSTANSATTTVTISPATVGGSVTGGTSICSGSTSGLLTLAGHTGTIVRWESSVSPFSTWTPIANTAATYTSGALSATTQFRAVVQSGSCATANSATTTVTVDPASVGGSLSAGVTQIFLGQTTGTITLSGITGTVVKWQKRLGAAAWTDITNTALTYSETPNAVGFWEYRAVVQSGSCSVANSATVIIEVLASSAGAVTGGNTPICLGTATGTMTLGGYTGTIVKWQKRVNTGSWTDITNTATTYSETPATAGTWEYRGVVNNGSDLYSAPVTIEVNALTVAGSVTGGVAICSGSTSGLLTLAGHTGTIVRWESSVSPFSTWTPISNTAATYTSGALIQTTQFRAVVQNGSCSALNSTSTTVTVSPTTVPGTVGSDAIVCTGSTSGLLTLTGHTGAIVRWESSVSPFSTWTPITNTVATYTSSALSATTQFRAVVQSGSCSVANSTPATITVSPATVGGSVSAGVTQIFNGQYTGNITLTGQTGVVVKWQKRLGAAAWSDIASTATTYSEIPSSVGFWEYRAVVQSGGCAQVNSASVIIEVVATNSGAVSGGTSPICLTSTTGMLTLSGYTGTIVKWQKSLNGGAWTDISNTAATYIETPSAAGSWEYRAVVNNGSDLFSGSVTIVVDPATVPGSVTGGTTICAGSTSALLTLAGNIGTIVRWESAVAPFTVWTPITNTAATYTSGALSATTQFRAVVQSGSCATANSVSTTVTVDPASVGGAVTSDASVCSGSNSGLLTLAGQTGTVVRWESSVSPFSTWTPIANTAMTYTSGAISETTKFRAVAQSGSCAEAYSTPATITVIPGAVAGTVTGGSTICEGSTSDLLTLSGHSGTIIKWQSAIAPFTTWSDIANTTDTYTSAGLSETTQFRAVLQNGSCPDVASVSTTVTVNPASIGGAVNGGTTICTGSTSATLTLTGNTGAVVRWQSAVTPFNTWVDIASTATTYVSGPLTEATQFRAVVQSGVCSQAVSTPTTVSVDAMPTPAFTSVSNMLNVVFANTSTGAVSYSWDFGSGGFTSIATSPSFTYPADGTYTVVLTAINGACTSTVSHDVTVTSIGIAENSTSSVKVYPIPSEGNITIEFGGAVDAHTVLNVYDITGKVVYTSKTIQLNANNSTVLDLSSLVPGVYRIQIKDNARVVNKGIIIK
jgi:PKD repeat protein